MNPEPPQPNEPSEGAFSVCVLGSGSRGNAIYVSDGATAILVDAGFSARDIDRRMHSRGLDPARLKAILVTHEHTDHVRGIERMVRRHRLPVYLTAGTRQEAVPLHSLPEIYPIACGREFRINTLGTQLQYLFMPVEFQGLHHQRHDEGLGNGLAKADAQGPVVIGNLILLRLHKRLARDTLLSLNYTLVGDFVLEVPE